MTPESTQIIMALATREALGSRYCEVSPEHIMLAVLKLAEIDFSKIPIGDEQAVLSLDHEQRRLRVMLRDHGLESSSLRRRLRAALGRGSGRLDGQRIHRSPATRKLFANAEELAQKQGKTRARADHLLAVLLEKPPSVLATILAHERLRKPVGVTIRVSAPGLADRDQEDGLGHLSAFLKALRDDLRASIFGQEHAIHTFVEGLWSAEMTASADVKRYRPKAVFLFVGPPGVGKTLLAETGARALDRPFLRFDMSAFSDHQSGSALTGVQPAFRNAQSGRLTSFVEDNPDAVVLFDEVEKAHLNVIQLFLQILDRGTLDDAYSGRQVVFRDTVIILTSNAGASLYDRPNRSGVTTLNSRFHRRAILDALARERDPGSNKPMFPAALISRLASGFPVMFNHLGINELEKIARAKLERQASLIAHQYGAKVSVDELAPLCLVLREGGDSDARVISSEAINFFKTEFFKICRLYDSTRIDEVLARVEAIDLGFDPSQTLNPELQELVHGGHRARVLLIADDTLSELWQQSMPDISWRCANSLAAVFDHLATSDFDLVLLDLWLGYEAFDGALLSPDSTIKQFDRIPASSRGIALGREILRKIHERRPALPTFLLSLVDPDDTRPGIDDELFLSCVRSGGARGLIATDFVSTGSENWMKRRNALQSEVAAVSRLMWRETRARELISEHRHLNFNTAPSMSEDGRRIHIRLRDMRFERVVAAIDASEILDEVERPSIGLDDIYGATTAKKELSFILDWLAAPERYRAMGLRQPRGILVHGAPGVGKTMLARAVAGECNAAILVASATSFITHWQGSGPQAIRDLFARARRYAPAIVFIDEIDAIGTRRRGDFDRATEQTLNAMLTEMDGFAEFSEHPTIVIAATNLVSALDPALQRRFDRIVEVDRPDQAARQDYLHDRLLESDRHKVTSACIQRLARLSVGLTIADLERIVQHAGKHAAQRDGSINDVSLIEAFDELRLGDIHQTPDPDDLLRIARHEAGHAYVAWAEGSTPTQISIIGRGRAGGWVDLATEETKLVVTKRELESRIRQSMAGRAAEIIFYGDEDGLSSAAANDLAQATRDAEAMVREFGMSPHLGQLHMARDRFNDGPIAMEVMLAAGRIVTKQLETVTQQLEDNREALELLIQALLEHNQLSDEEIESLLT